MNLIEIAENLKDLPDQYLFQEVQAPTGNFPTYLVITELGRRKRMRESVAKEMPQTTVAEDLTAPQRQQAMAQMAQDQNMIPQAGGLNTLPQAQQDLAAMDMMSAQPQMSPQMQEIPAMAGGGMVSFRQGGDIKRFSQGDFVNLPLYEEPSSGPAGSMGELFSNMIPSMRTLSNVERRIDPVTGEPVSLGEYLRLQDQRNAAAARQKLPVLAATPVATASTTTPTAPAGAPSVTPAGSPSATRVPVARPVDSSMFTLPTDAERAAAAKAGLELYERAMPDRLVDFRADLQARQAEMAGRKESNINEALIQAGLGMMGSSSPYFLQALSQGALGGFKGYKEGMKDIREGQNAIRQSQLEMNKAEMLRDQDKFKQAREAEDRAVNMRVKGAELFATENAINVRNTLLPEQIKEIQARTAAYGLRGVPKAPTTEERTEARLSLSQRGIKPPYSIEQINQEVLKMREFSTTSSAPASGDYLSLTGG